MNPWIAAYLGAHVMAIVVVLSTWPVYTPYRRLSTPDKFNRATFYFVLPVILILYVAYFWLRKLYSNMLRNGVKKGYEMNTNEMWRSLG